MMYYYTIFKTLLPFVEVGEQRNQEWLFCFFFTDATILFLFKVWSSGLPLTCGRLYKWMEEAKWKARIGHGFRPGLVFWYKNRIYTG